MRKHWLSSWAHADPPVRITRPPKVKNVINQTKLRAAERELQRGGSVMEFLHTARHTFGRVNQKYCNLLINTIEEDDEIGGEIQEIQEEDDAPAEVGHGILQLKTIDCKLNTCYQILQVQTQQTNDENNDDQNRCVICLDRPKNAIFIPCAHGQFCNPCGQELMIRERPEPKCPICREIIAQCYQIY